MRSKAKQIRDRWAELRKLINDWDPVGLIAAGTPTDEYDCVSGPLLRKLEEQASATEIAKYLAAEFSDHFGVTIAGAPGFAKRVVSWHRTFESAGKAT